MTKAENPYIYKAATKTIHSIKKIVGNWFSFDCVIVAAL